MKILISRLTICIFMCITTSASAEGNIIEVITNNIVKVCNKPDDAGSYWDVRVKGGGDAAIKLKLAEIGLTGEADFSKGEWDGVRSTVEDAKSYRECVKSLSPIFINKFSKLMPQEQNEKPQPRILGGVKWQEFGLGLDMILNFCNGQGSTVTCNFSVKANDSDTNLMIYGKSAIYDQNGKKYVSSYVSIANFKGAMKNTYSSLSGELVKGVETNIIIRFTDVGDDAKVISKAMVVTFVKSKGINSSHNYAFRNVKIDIK